MQSMQQRQLAPGYTLLLLRYCGVSIQLLLSIHFLHTCLRRLGLKAFATHLVSFHTLMISEPRWHATSGLLEGAVFA